jgi:hypothetical protein
MSPPSSIGWPQSSPLLLLCQEHFGSQQLQRCAQLLDTLRADAVSPIGLDPQREAAHGLAVGAAARSEADTRRARVVRILDSLDIPARLEIGNLLSLGFIRDAL